MADTTTTTETIKFDVNAREFLQKLDRISKRLGAFGTAAEESAKSIETAFREMTGSATGLNTAIKKAGEGIKGTVGDFRNLANALAKLNRESESEKVEKLAAAFGRLDRELADTNAVYRFSTAMTRLSEAMAKIKKEAIDAAKAVAELKKAADKELGLNRVRTMTPEAAKRDVIKTQRAEIALREQIAKAAEAAAARVEKADKRAGRSARKRATETVGAFKAMERAAAGLRIRLLNLRTGFAFLGGGFLTKRVITFAGDFEEALARVNTIIQDQSEVQLPRYKEQLLGLAQEGPQDLIDLSNALYQIISSGIPTVEGAGGAFEVLATAQKASVAGVSTLTQAADALVTTLNGFRRESLSSTDAADKLFATVRLGRTRFDLLARSVGRVAALADDFGVGSDELLGGLAAITRVIPSTSEAVTQLRALITGIVRPTVRATEVLNKLTENRTDLRDLLSAGGLQQRGLVETLRQLTEVTGGSADAITKLFPNVRALAASAILGGRNFEQFEEIVQGVADSGGAADAAFNKMRFTFNNVAAVFRNKLATILIRIGDQIMPKLVELFERLGAFLLKNQDKIVKFFSFLADVLIKLVNLAQKFSNQILGALAGAATGKVLGWLAQLVPQVRRFFVKEASEIGNDVGKEFSASLVGTVATASGAVVGVVAGRSLFDIQTDVEGELALDKAQPIFSEDAARQAGFKTAEQYKDALNKAVSGAAALVDGAVVVADFEEVRQQLDFKKAIESAETLDDVFKAIRLSVKRTGSDFGTLEDQINNAFSSTEELRARVGVIDGGGSLFFAPTKDVVELVDAEIKDLRTSFGQTADLLEARAPEVAAALRSIADDKTILSIDGLQDALIRLKDTMPGVEKTALRLGARVADFREFLPGGAQGEQRSASVIQRAPDTSLGMGTENVFDLLNVRSESDPFFARLKEQETAILKQIEESQISAADTFGKTIGPAIQERIFREEELAKILEQKNKIEQSSLFDVDARSRLPALVAEEKGVRAVITALDDKIATEEAAIKAQEDAARRSLATIRELIEEILRQADLLRKQEEVRKALNKQSETEQKARLDQIKDNGLIQRIQNAIAQAEVETKEAAIATARVKRQMRVSMAESLVEYQKQLGFVKRQEEAERALYRAKVETLAADRDSIAEEEKAIKRQREQIANARIEVDLKREVDNLGVQIARQEVILQNAKEQTQKDAANEIKKALEDVQKQADDLLKEGVGKLPRALADRLSAIYAQIEAETAAAVQRIEDEIRKIAAEQALRPSAQFEFNQAVDNSTLRFLEIAQSTQQVLRGVDDTLRNITNTQQQIRLEQVEATVTGQVQQAFTGELDVQRLREANRAIDAELKLLSEQLGKNIEEINLKAFGEQDRLTKDIAEKQRQIAAVSSKEQSDRLALELVELQTQLNQSRDATSAKIRALLAENAQRKEELELSRLQIAQNKALVEAQKGAVESGIGLADALTFGGVSLAQFAANFTDAFFTDDVAVSTVALTKVLEVLKGALDTVSEKIKSFAPEFGRLFGEIFDSLLQGPQRVIDGLSTAFTGVFDILFGGFQEAIQSILGFDFFGDQDQQERDTLPSVDLRGRFFDQRPEERARVLDEIRAQGEARDRLAAGNAAQAPLSPADQARQILERAIETAVKATEVIVEILPELLETFLEKVIDLLPSIAGKLAQAVAAGIRVLADKFDEILISVLKALEEALPVLLESIGEAVPIIIANLVARLPEIVYRVLKALGLGVGGLFSGLGQGFVSLFHSGGKVKGTQRQPGLASMMQSLGAPGFATGGTVTPASLTQGMLNRRLQRDEVPAVLQAGERVVSRQELARMGGEAALNQFLANGGAAGGGGSFDGVIQGLSPQAAAAFAQAFAQAMRGFMGQQVAYNPNLGARAGRGRSF